MPYRQKTDLVVNYFCGNSAFLDWYRLQKCIADDILKRKLESRGAVLIEDPKWCGKTTTAEQIAASVLYMDDPEKKEQNSAMSELSPRRLSRGAWTVCINRLGCSA